MVLLISSNIIHLPIKYRLDGYSLLLSDLLELNEIYDIRLLIAFVES